jgi:hypothetical protein
VNLEVKMKGTNPLVAGVFIILLVAIAFLAASMFGFQLPAVIPGGGQPSACPDDGKSNVTFNVQNIDDTTTTDTYDITMVCSGNKGHIKTITATTDDGTTLNCDESYTCRGVSSTGVKGDHANFQSILAGNAQVSNGVVSFTPTTASERIDIGTSLHGIVQARLYDNDVAAFCFGTTSGEVGGVAGAWLNTTTYIDSSTNATNFAVGSGGGLDLCFDYRIYAHTDESFMDFYYYVLIDANSNVWDTPVVTVDGVTMSDYSGSLNVDESKAYSAYEYAYKVTDQGSEITNVDTVKVCIAITALAGVDPTTDINVSLSSGGTYAKTAKPTEVGMGAVDDSSSQTQIFAIHTNVIDIS